MQFVTQAINYLKNMGIYMTTVQWRDVLEILIIAFLLYYILAWMKNTRAWSLLKGIIVIALFLASIMQLDTIIWIAKNVVNYAIIALLLVLQPELRKGLENLGRKNILGDILSTTGINSTDVESISAESISEIVKACTEMGKARTGALIVIQRAEFLSEYETTGIAVDGKITSGLLINIFEKNTPLHDGAVIIVGNRVTAATCYLPLSDNMGLSKDLGTRHRAAVGVSEKTDAVTIIVSEETGRISLAIDGKIEPISDGEQLKTRLTKLVSKAREKRRKTRRRRSDENNTEVKTGEGAANEKV